MAALMKRTGRFRLPKPANDHFAALAESILYQQLAGAAAAAIHRRFMARFDGALSPRAVLALHPRKLRAVGLSRNKAASIRDLAAKVADGTVPLHQISELSDEEIVARLSVVRGIGRWTAEMFLIFQLRRLDVWPVTDYGIRQGYSLARRQIFSLARALRIAATKAIGCKMRWPTQADISPSARSCAGRSLRYLG
jgi:DNA-3-methyladenine glycosylase II